MSRKSYIPYSPDGWLSSEGFPVGAPLGSPADSASAEILGTDPTGFRPDETSEPRRAAPAQRDPDDFSETTPRGSVSQDPRELVSPNSREDGAADPRGTYGMAPQETAPIDSHSRDPQGNGAMDPRESDRSDPAAPRDSDTASGQPSTFARIYAVVRRIPRGRVATYGQVALLAGNPRWARVVGYALHVNPDPQGIPCYRVVNRLGGTSSAFAFGGEDQQRRLLEGDGVAFTADGRVDLSRFLWDGK